MKKEMLKKIWHFNTCQIYNNIKFINVLNESNICTDSCIEYELKNAYTDKPITVSGFLAKKDKKLYLIQRDWIKDFPLVISNSFECIIKENGKHVLVLKNKHSLKFKPEKFFEYREMIDGISPFKNTNDDNYIIFKNAMISSWMYKNAIAVCTPSGFGKDGINTPLEFILPDYKKIKEFKTIPAFLREITSNGILIVNEACGNLDKNCVEVLEKFIMDLGDKSPIFKNPSLASLQHGTKDLYDISNESIICIYNTINQYKRKEKYFDYQFQNNDGVKDRILQLKTNGKLIEKFEEDVDYNALANEEEIKDYFKKIILTMLYFKEEKFIPKWKWNTPQLNVRHEYSFKNICKCLDRYSLTQEEYSKYEYTLSLWIINYKRMLDNLPEMSLSEYIQERNGTGVIGSLGFNDTPISSFSSNQSHFTFNPYDLTPKQKELKTKPLREEIENKLIIEEETIKQSKHATILDILKITDSLEAKTFMKIPNWETELEHLKKTGQVFENPAGTIRLLK